MRAKNEVIFEILERNEVRKLANLPLLSVTDEFDKISKAEKRQDFLIWQQANPALLLTVKETVLQEFRRDLQDPGWVPRGYLSGGGAGYGLAVEKKMWEHFNDSTIA